MLLGTTGAGKSSLGNCLLGDRRFRVSSDPRSCTEESSEVERGFWFGDGEEFELIDTPGEASAKVFKLGKASKKNIESVIMIIPCRTPPLFLRTVIALGFFFATFFLLIGCFRYVLKHILGMFETNFS